MPDEGFEPQRGYRALRFGMSPTAAEGVLGPAVRTRRAVDIPHLLPEEEDLAKNVVSHDFDGYRPYHDKEVSLTFENDRLVSIFLNDAAEPVVFRGMNLFGDDRTEVARKLFEMDDDLYGNREAGFFGELGIVISWASFIKKYGTGYVEFVDSEYVFERLDFLTYDQIDEPLR